MHGTVPPIPWGMVKLGFPACLALLLAACAPRLADAPALPPAPRPPAPVAVDFVEVDKSDRSLTLFGQGQALRRYSGLQFGDAPQGHKRFEGDERTPEGRYIIDYRNPQSAYHLSLQISYPDAQDRAYAQSFGRSPGDQIFIHGQPNGVEHRIAGDWTDGCIALANHEIEEIWRFVPDGTPIEIRP